MRRVLDWIDTHHRASVGLILLVALAIRLALLLLTPDYAPIYDSGDYDRHARSIAAGDGYPGALIGAAEGPSAFRPPLYPFILGAVYAVVGDQHGVDAGRVLGALMGVGVVALIFIVARQLGGPRAGLVAAGLAAVFPPLALIHLSLITEPVFLLLELGILSCALKARASGDFGWVAAAGALCGLAALTRGNGALLVLVVAAAVWTGRPLFSRRALVAPLVVCAASALVIAPWTVRNTLVFDTVVPISTQNGYGMAGAFNDEARAESTWIVPELTARYEDVLARPDLDEAELDDELRSDAFGYLADHPLIVPRGVALNSLRVAGLVSLGEEQEAGDQLQLGLGPTSYSLVRWSFLAFAGAAIVAFVYLLLRTPHARPPAFVLVAPALLVLSAVWIAGNTRYRVPLDPIVVILIGLAVAAWLEPRRPEAAAGPES